MAASEGTAGRFIADALAAAGVRIAFTVPGESFLPLLDGLDAAGCRVVATRHEGGAGFMAAAHGALTGRPAAVLVTRAVGAANVAVALHAAHADSVPLVALVGQVERAARGREAFQEVDLVATFGGLCTWAREVRDVHALPSALDEALRRATTGRPGPVLLSLPEDLLDEPAPADPGRIATATVLGPSRAPEPDPTTVRRILHLLLDAERPVILAGAGVLRSRATADLVRLAELAEVPVVAAWRRPDVFPNDHALYLGMSGYFSAPNVHPRLLAADAVLVLGCRLNEVASHGWTVPADGARWAHVDLEPLGARGPLGTPTVALAADARTFAREARRLLAGGVLELASLERRRAANLADRAAYEEARVVDAEPWDGPGVHPGRVIATLGRVLPPDAIITTDAGHFGGWAARGLWWRRPGTFLGTTAGAMGFAVPSAIAASLAAPGRPVVALAGDGGMGMTGAELETAVREGARPVVLVFDNQRYGTIRDHQDRRGHAPVATDLGPVDWVAFAGAWGAAAARVDTDAAFEPALRAALASRQPTVLHLVVDRRWASVDRIDDGIPAPAEAAGSPVMAESVEPEVAELPPAEPATAEAAGSPVMAESVEPEVAEPPPAEPATAEAAEVAEAEEPVEGGAPSGRAEPETPVEPTEAESDAPAGRAEAETPVEPTPVEATPGEAAAAAGDEPIEAAALAEPDAPAEPGPDDGSPEVPAEA